MKNRWKSFIGKSKEEYYMLRPIVCPVFSNDNMIVFNKHGFNHLISKGRRYRLHSEQVRRIRLLPYAVEVLKKADSFQKYEKRIHQDSIAEFWTLKRTIELHQVTKTVNVIIRKTNNGQLHFFSVFDE